MLGLDDRIASLGDGASITFVVLVAVLLGLRHAADPDHLAAVTMLIASGKERTARAAGKLGLAWGLGHGTTLTILGLPIVLFGAGLPEPVQQGAEIVVAVVIVFLAARLLVRWHRGAFHVHEHAHAGVVHSHLHGHSQGVGHAHAHRPRSALGACAIGLLHGMGGSAGVSVLILASIDSTAVAAIALVVLAVFTALSMTILTTGFGLTIGSRLVRRAFHVVAPALGVASLGFGVWYGLSALRG